MAKTSHSISQPRDHKLIVEKDVKIPMRDGAMLWADVLRPDCGAERMPAIMNIGHYQKDRLWIPPEDLEEKANPYLAWERTVVPFYSVGNWSGMGLHLRGNTEAFMHAASKHKKLRIHSGTHFHPFHSEEGRMDQLRFFDYWLKGIDTGIMEEPPVKLMIRTSGDTKSYKFRFENE